MPNTKKISHPWSETGKTVYSIVRREADSYRLDDADGSFGTAPADPYLSLTEDSVIKGLYEVSESRMTWNDGKYTVTIYKQAGGSPAPASDTIIGAGEIYISNDTEVVAEADIALLVAFVKNKKYMKKVGNTWYLIIRNSADTGDILNKALKDKDVAEITDLLSGTLAQELASSV